MSFMCALSEPARGGGPHALDPQRFARLCQRLLKWLENANQAIHPSAQRAGYGAHPCGELLRVHCVADLLEAIESVGQLLGEVGPGLLGDDPQAQPLLPQRGGRANEAQGGIHGERDGEYDVRHDPGSLSLMPIAAKAAPIR